MNRINNNSIIRRFYLSDSLHKVIQYLKWSQQHLNSGDFELISTYPSFTFSTNSSSESLQMTLQECGISDQTVFQIRSN